MPALASLARTYLVQIAPQDSFLHLQDIYEEFSPNTYLVDMSIRGRYKSYAS